MILYVIYASTYRIDSFAGHPHVLAPAVAGQSLKQTKAQQRNICKRGIT